MDGGISKSTKKKIVGLFGVLVITAISFTTDQMGKYPLNLENLDLNIEAEKFYAPSLEKARIYRQQRDAILRGKNEQDFGDKLIDPWSFETISIDSIFKNDDHSHKPIGFQYNMKSWTEGDSLASFGNMYFHAVNMMCSSEGKFMALVATNQNEDEKPFKELLYAIEKKYGRAERKKEEFFGEYYTYRWQLKDRILAISSKYNDKINEIKVAVDPVSGTVDTAKHPSIDTKFFLVNNKYRKAISGKLKSGAWLYFDKLLEN